jgi:hypothetical protein
MQYVWQLARMSFGAQHYLSLDLMESGFGVDNVKQQSFFRAQFIIIS